MNQDKGIRIGVIGPESMLEKMEKPLKAFPSFQPVMRFYNSEKEAGQLAAELQNDVEVILFTGEIPYQWAIQDAKYQVPVQYIPLTGTGLYRAFYRLRKKGCVTKISTDSIEGTSIKQVYNELEETPEHLLVNEARFRPDREKLIEFHRKAYEDGHVKAAITGIKSVSRELDRLGIPNEWVYPSEQDIIVALERALLSTESRRSKESQIVVGLVNIDDFHRLAEQKSSEHDVQRLKLDIHRMILNYIESLDGYLTPLGGDEYLFMTTRGLFEQQTGGYKSIPLAREVDKAFGITLSIGIGFGRSAHVAGAHARTALRHAKDAGGNICFIVREDKSVIGPLQMSRPNAYDLSLIDHDLIEKAELGGLNSVYLSKLVAHMTRTGKVDFIAQELASVLSVTVRSTHRFLLTWMDAGLIEIVGEKKGRSRGRPKQIYRLSFLARLVR